jgi:DNA-binding protein Fis
MAALERRLLGEALAANRHSQKLAALHLGLGYHQFRNRLKKHGLIGA